MAANQQEKLHDTVKNLKDILDALEKARNLEKLARSRLQTEGLALSEQQTWAGTLQKVSSTIEKIEKKLPTVLTDIDNALG